MHSDADNASALAVTAVGMLSSLRTATAWPHESTEVFIAFPPAPPPPAPLPLALNEIAPEVAVPAVQEEKRKSHTPPPCPGDAIAPRYRAVAVAVEGSLLEEDLEDELPLDSPPTRAMSTQAVTAEEEEEEEEEEEKVTAEIEETPPLPPASLRDASSSDSRCDSTTTLSRVPLSLTTASTATATAPIALCPRRA